MSDDSSIVSVYRGVLIAEGVGTTMISCKTVDGDYAAYCTVTVKAREIDIPDSTATPIPTVTPISTPTPTSSSTVTNTPTSAPSDSKSIVNNDSATIKAPKSLSVKKKSKNSAKITWKKVDGAQGYVIYRSIRKKSGYTVVATIKSGKTNNFIDKKLKKKTKYYYQIIVVLNGNSVCLRVIPNAIQNKKYIWSSKSKKVATVSSLGMIRALKPGKTTITVKIKGGKKATCNITVW